MNTLNHYEIIADFKDFAQTSAGIELPDNLKADGKLHRFKINGEKSGKLSGAYILHLDGKPAGYIQDFRTDTKLNWTFKGDYQGEPISQADIKRKQQQAEPLTDQDNGSFNNTLDTESHYCSVEFLQFVDDKHILKQLSLNIAKATYLPPHTVFLMGVFSSVACRRYC
jgi:hypothetical protein